MVWKKKSPFQFAKEAMEMLGTEEKIKLAEAIGQSIPNELSLWIEKKYDELLETDEEDIRLAEEALAEYHENQGAAIEGGLFFKQLKEKYGEKAPVTV